MAFRSTMPWVVLIIEQPIWKDEKRLNPFTSYEKTPNQYGTETAFSGNEERFSKMRARGVRADKKQRPFRCDRERRLIPSGDERKEERKKRGRSETGNAPTRRDLARRFSHVHLPSVSFLGCKPNLLERVSVPFWEWGGEKEMEEKRPRGCRPFLPGRFFL